LKLRLKKRSPLDVNDLDTKTPPDAYWRWARARNGQQEKKRGKMDLKDLAKLIAAQEPSAYTTAYFNRVDATYQCVIENVVMTENKRSFQKRIAWEFRVIENDGTEGATLAGTDTKVIYTMEDFQLQHVQNHIASLLGVDMRTLEADEREQLILEALEPREDKDGKSIFSGMSVRVRTTMKTSEKRIADGKDPYVLYTITPL
jgi:hypothetical protein